MKKLLGLIISIAIFTLACFATYDINKVSQFNGIVESSEGDGEAVRYPHVEMFHFEDDTLLSFKIASVGSFDSVQFIVADYNSGEIRYQENAENFSDCFQKIVPPGDYRIYVEKTGKSSASFNYAMLYENLRLKKSGSFKILYNEYLF